MPINSAQIRTVILARNTVTKCLDQCTHFFLLSRSDMRSFSFFYMKFPLHGRRSRKTIMAFHLPNLLLPRHCKGRNALYCFSRNRQAYIPLFSSCPLSLLQRSPTGYLSARSRLHTARKNGIFRYTFANFAKFCFTFARELAFPAAAFPL